ncbi:GntR family transcriptional regulator [Streptomyces sp. NPDC087270]|uniref:GntR family transcriptional regulator n=1 Tax=Streptomyces sp. NPDC087270 TaxID=3365774 RepID=UPI0037FE67AA
MTARHQVVADDLRRLITAGDYAEGERLPPETRLAARYHVSTPTLRDALELLRAEGLIAKHQGRGNFVCRAPQRLTYPSAADDLDVIVSAQATTAIGELADHLGRPPDEPLTEYVLLSHRDDAVQSLARIYVPLSVAKEAGVVRVTRSSPWGMELFVSLAAGSGSSMVISTDQVTARFPTGAEAQSLRITARTPLLAIERTLKTDEGQVLAYALVVLPGDRAEAAFTVRIGTESPTEEVR